MRNFNIQKPNSAIAASAQEKIDNLTKPKGSLGMLEDLALQISLIQQTLTPQLKNQHHIIFAADHGIVEEGVSVSPKEVTRQMVYNFQKGGAGINFLARQHNFALKIVDAGVDHDFSGESLELIDMKIRRGTRNYLHEAAMSREEMELAIDRGAEIATMCHNDGCNIISYGEMGITNTSSSSLWMSLLTGVDLKLCVGAGSDASNGITAHKYSVLKHAKESYKGDGSAEDVMAYFGGYEMVMAVGAMLRAAELGMVVLIDGFIMSACALMSTKLYPASKEYFIFAHQGDESGHKLLLEAMDAHGILSLNLRLGEGTGALCAYPIVESAVRMICEMSSFERVNVTKYF